MRIDVSPGQGSFVMATTAPALQPEDTPEAASTAPVVCVSLEGALLRTSGFHELLWAALRSRPLALLLLPYWLLRGIAFVEDRLASMAMPEPSRLPYRPELVAWLRAQQADGARLVLVRRGDRRLAEAVARELGFDAVVSLPSGELAGELQRRHGEGWVWVGSAGDSREIWSRAAAGVFIGSEQEAARAVGRKLELRATFPRGSTWRAWVKALRPHQWVKNALVFVPAMASHRFLEGEVLLATIGAAVAFSLAASSVYVLNDLLDLEADRHHPSKRRRPFAAGAVPLGAGLAMVPLLVASAMALGWFLPAGFLPVLGIYLLTTLAYSLGLKQVAIADVVVLAGLYTVRIFAGAEASEVPVSPWLLAFSMFVFLSLALLKRYSELRGLDESADRVRGRGYRPLDAAPVSSLGAAAGYAAVLVLALFVSSSDVRELYSHPERLWAICPLVLYWISRVWLLAHRGEVHDDPVVFALRDRVSHVVGVLLVVVMLAAR